MLRSQSKFDSLSARSVLSVILYGHIEFASRNRKFIFAFACVHIHVLYADVAPFLLV